MTENIIVEEVLQKKPKFFGSSSHIILPKRYKGRTIFVLLIADNIRKPYVHYDRPKKINNKTYYQAEITDEAGTHGFWIEKDKLKELFIRNPL